MAQTRLLQVENVDNKILTQGKLFVSQTENPLCRSLKIQARQNAALWQKDMTHLVCMCVRMYVCMRAYRTEDKFSHCSSGTVPLSFESLSLSWSWSSSPGWMGRKPQRSVCLCLHCSECISRQKHASSL